MPQSWLNDRHSFRTLGLSWLGSSIACQTFFLPSVGGAFTRLLRRCRYPVGRQRQANLLLCLVGALLLPGCQKLDNIKLIMPPSFSGMEALAKDVWVEQEASAEQRAQALVLRDQGRERAAQVLGPLQAVPTHVFCHTDACFDRLGGGKSRAKTFISWRALYSPRGLTPAYVAHESWHAEFKHRVGRVPASKTPAWFEEGVGVWISADPEFGEDVFQQLRAKGIEPPALTELETAASFNLAMDRFDDYNWAAKAAGAPSVVHTTAAHEVRRWVGVVGPGGLLELLDGLAGGADFQTLYTGAENKKR